MLRALSCLLLPLLILSAVPDVCAQRQPSTEVARTFAITGQVRFNDSGRGVEMLRVELKRFTGEGVATAFTGGNGEFEFSGLLRGTYILNIVEDGYEQIQERIELGTMDRRGIFLYLKKLDDQQTPQPGATVSARELRLPAKAVAEYRKGYKKLHERRDPEGSLGFFRRAVKILPDYYEAHYEMGVGYLQLGKQDDAEGAFRLSIEHGKDAYAEPFFGLAAVLCNHDKFAECEAATRQGMAIDANSWQGHYQLARSLVGLNRLPEAEAHLRVVTKQHPTFAEPYLAYANIYIRRQDLPSLLRVLDEYLRLEPAGPMSENVRQTRDAVRRELDQAAKRNP
jgi:tetratricopeptide (TPR) repeat protein